MRIVEDFINDELSVFPDTLKRELSSIAQDLLPILKTAKTTLDEIAKKDCAELLCNGELMTDVVYIADKVNILTEKIIEIDYILSFRDYLFFRDCQKLFSVIRDGISGIKVPDSFNADFISSGDIAKYDKLTYSSYSQTINDIISFQKQRKDIIANVKEIIETTCLRLSKEIDSILKSNYPIKDRVRTIEEEAREFFAANKDKEAKKLMKQARKLIEPWQKQLTENHWCLMKTTEEEAMNLAVKSKLVDEKDKLFDGYKDEERREMERYGQMTELVADCFSDDQLFDFKGLLNVKKNREAFNYDNLDMCYRLILRGNIIRCNLYPELKPKFESWMKGEVPSVGNKESRDVMVNTSKSELSEADKVELKEMQEILSKGRWNIPASKTKAAAFVEVLYGAKPEQLDSEDIELSTEFRKFFRVGKGSRYFSRLQVSVANVIGYLMECGYLDKSPQQLSKDFFANEGNKNNINKGKEGLRSETFNKLIPFMDKYRVRIIEKHS